MVRPKVFVYATGARWQQGAEAVASSPGKPDIRVSPPPEMHGQEGCWTPESLFISSVETCLLFTFLFLARSRNLVFTAYESQAEGELEPVYGRHVISRVTVRPRIVVPTEAEAEKARAVASELEQHCFISNSIESEVRVQPEIVVQPAA